MLNQNQSLVLRAESIYKKFGDVVAVDHLSLELFQGKCLALLGPNGAGKTTLCEILEGLSLADSGEVSIFGKNLRLNRSEILQDIGVSLQETSLYKKFTVKESVELFASFYKHSLDPDTLIADLGLTEKADTRLEKLSGGQKQRVYLACTLVNDPKLLFLDEPTSGLDPQSRRMIWDFLLQFKAKDRAIFLTTHFMEEAAYLADSIAIMDRGRIMASGTSQELIDRYCQGSQLYFECQPDTWEVLRQNMSWLNSAVRTGFGYTVPVIKVEDAILELMNKARSQDLVVDAVQVRRSSLEDVFLQLTGRSIRDA